MFPRVDICLPTQTGSSLRVGTVSRPCDALSLAFPSSHLTPPAGRGSLGSSITYTTCILSHSVIFDSWQPHELQPTRLLCSWDSPSKNTEVGCHFLLPPPPGDLPNPGIELVSPASSSLAGRFFTTGPPLITQPTTRRST